MQLKTVFLAALAALPSVVPSTALAEGDSPWLPIPAQFSLSLNHTQQSGSDAYIGSKLNPISGITGGGASKYRRSTTSVRADYGLSDSVALDATLGYGDVKVGGADSDNGQTDSTLGLRWRVLDEYENPTVPTLTLRAAAIIKGSYDGARLASVGKAANGFEAAVVLGKQLGPAFALWGEVGVQNRSASVPNASFIELGARWRFAPKFSASLGYASKKFGGNLDIGGSGFSPARFQQVREERGVVKLGVAYAIAGNQTLGLNLAKATSGRNSVKDDQIAGLTYTIGF